MARRLLQAIVTLLAATLLIYAAVFVIAATRSARCSASAGREPGKVEQLRDVYHLDEPLWEQYGLYLWGLAHGDFNLLVDIASALIDPRVRLPQPAS